MQYVSLVWGIRLLEPDDSPLRSRIQTYFSGSEPKTPFSELDISVSCKKLTTFNRVLFVQSLVWVSQVNFCQWIKFQSHSVRPLKSALLCPAWQMALSAWLGASRARAACRPAGARRNRRKRTMARGVRGSQRYCSGGGRRKDTELQETTGNQNSLVFVLREQLFSRWSSSAGMLVWSIS